MSKERLEEIKMLWEQNNDVCFPDDYEWLIEQAEQVQELEEQLQGLHKMYDIRLAKSDEFEEQNKRYREAIILALQAQKEHGLSAGLVIKCMTQELERALECEE